MSWANAHDAEIEKHGPNGLHTDDLVDALQTDRHITYKTTYKAKRNQHGGLESYKVRLAIKGDIMRQE